MGCAVSGRIVASFQDIKGYEFEVVHTVWTRLSVGPSTGQYFGETRAMLVLSRKKNESIIIDENIVITVVEIRGDRVRLGIQAPREVPIHRSEIHAAIQLEQAAAAKKDPPKVFPAEA
jgi:carbon storage regulator